MWRMIRHLAIGFLLLLTLPYSANSDDSLVFDGNLRILGLGSLIFPDGSVQTSASVQGPQGPQGLTGPQGPQGPPGPAGDNYSALNYYALGDSITYGLGSTSGLFSYADRLHSKLAFNSLTKLGVNGTTVMPSLLRSELATQANNIGADADIITVLIGVNDYQISNPIGDVDAVLLKPYANLDRNLSFAEAFRYCLETIKRNHEQARVYVILPLQTILGGPISLDQYRTAEIKIANYLSIPVISAHTESGLWSGGTLMPDGVHPSDAGYTVLGNYIARKIIGL